jgi:hypothetical protein
MGSASDYLENKLLDAALGNGFSKPATTYIALFTAAPSDSGGGTECAGGSYARSVVTNNTTNWPNASSSIKANGTAFSFPIATAGWGDVVAWAIFDASSGGNMLYWGLTTATVTVATGESCQFPIGALAITCD